MIYTLPIASAKAGQLGPKFGLVVGVAEDDLAELRISTVVKIARGLEVPAGDLLDGA